MPVQTPTVLVLGAGASAPYGFPTGRTLLDAVCEIRGNVTNSLLLELGHSASDVQTFVDELRHSAHTSVDRFLEENPDFLEVGKHAMAAIMLPLEREERLFPPLAANAHWYEYVANHLHAGAEDWFANKLGVVTFNYDRSLEHYFTRVIAQRARVSPDRAFEMFSRLPLVHVHGALGDYPPTRPSGLEYGAALTARNVVAAAASLLVVSQVTDTLPTFDDAEKLLTPSSNIIFLGFGFLAANVRRLRIFNETVENPKPREVLGTTMGITPREWDSIRHDIFKGHWTAGTRPDHGVLEFLRHWVNLD